MLYGAPFLRQTDKPLFPGIFWNRPTLKSRGGRLLVVGGHQHEFNLLQNIYQIAEASGIGFAQAAMPESLRKLLGGGEFGRFLPTTISGSLARVGLGELLHLAEDYDGVVVGANLTNNSETSILIESFVERTDRPLIITKEAIDILHLRPELITGNPSAMVVATMLDTYALARNHNMPLILRRNAGVTGKIEVLAQLASISKCGYVVFDKEIIVVSEEKVSVTPLNHHTSDTPELVIGLAATLWLQQRSKPFEALTTAAFVAKEASASSEAPTTASLAKAVRSTLARNEESA